MYDTQLPSQPIPADPKRKSLDESSLIGSYEFLTLKDPRVCKNFYIVKNIMTSFFSIIHLNQVEREFNLK